MTKRSSGILLHITSLASPYGVGDLGPEAYAFADFLSAAGQSYWQILPLNPTNHENGHSPYFSCSAFAGNPLLISFDILVEEGLLRGEDVADWPKGTPGRADFDILSVNKIKILEKAYKRFIKNNDLAEYGAFCVENAAWLDDYALFKALKHKYNGKEWNKWPEGLKDRVPAELDAAAVECAEFIEQEKFYQYIFHRQWKALRKYCNDAGIKIIGDLPIYVSYDSADVWVEPDIFKLDEDKVPTAVSGVPPDYFSATGQLWNNPVYRWDVLKKTRYDWWIRRFESTFSKYDMVRIDHFRGLVQYWEVPAGEETAINGSWEDVPTYDFFDVLTKHFPGFPVIAEDLGIITPDVREAMEHYGFPGMKVIEFAFGDDNPDQPYRPHNYERNCLTYTGTHDNNTFFGWYKDDATLEEKIRFSRYLFMKDAPDIYEPNWEAIRLVMASVADTAIVPLQDILGLDGWARMNQPAKMFGNWQWRLKPGELNEGHMERFRAITREYSRFRKKQGKKGQ